MQFKCILATDKNRFVFGADIYSNIKNINEDNILKFPSSSDYLVGSHGMLIIGFDNSKGFEVANSWNVGNKGIHFISYRYIMSDLCYDFMLLL